MNLFKKLFKKKESEFTPDNSVLLQLIQAYHQNETPENYKKVIEELYGPRAFLVVPTDGEQSKSNEWKTLEKGTSVAFTTVFDVEGMLVFAVRGGRSVCATLSAHRKVWLVRMSCAWFHRNACAREEYM